MKSSRCKICRRQGVKLFLRGEKCLSQKCPVMRKPYPPGPKTKRRFKSLSEYGKELKEKQKLKKWYNLEEKQFKAYIKKVLDARGKVPNAAAALIQTLENRLDNVIFRLGFAASRSAARQIISHGHILVNGKHVNIPSFSVKKGDKINIKPGSLKKKIFQNLLQTLKKYHPPSWLELDAGTLEGKVKDVPSLEESAPPAEISSIFEFYSR